MVKKRGRVPRRAAFVDFIDVSLNEYDAAECPVAVRWRNADPGREPHPERELRFHNGKFWSVFTERAPAPLFALDPDEFIPMTVDRMVRSINGDTSISAGPLGGERRFREFEALDPENYKSVIEDGSRERRIGIIRSRAEKVAIIDGLIWKEYPEPKICVSDYREIGTDRRKKYLTVGHRNMEHLGQFRLTDLDLANEYLETAFPGNDRVMNALPEIEILTPEVFAENCDFKDLKAHLHDLFSTTESMGVSDGDLYRRCCDDVFGLHSPKAIDADAVSEICRDALECAAPLLDEHQFRRLEFTITRFMNSPELEDSADIRIDPQMGM